MNKIVINVEGMHCAACSAAVEKSINRLQGVDDVSVNLTAGNALIYFDENTVDITQIIEAVNNAGFKASLPENKERKEVREQNETTAKKAKRRLLFSVIFAIPLFYLSMGHMLGAPLFDYINPEFNPVNYALAQLVFCVPVLISGSEIFKNALNAAIHKNVNMDTLIAMGSAVSFFYSIYSLIKIIGGDSSYVHQLYFESAGMILTFILIGRYLETASKKKTNSAIEKLLDLSPETALIAVDGKEKEVSSSSLKIGDIVIVKSGMTIPVDGKIICGYCTADESMLTGESLPVEKKEGDNVFGGTINTNGYITFEVTANIHSSAPAKIAECVSLAQTTKAPIANLANKIASIFVPSVLAIATTSAFAWLIAGETPDFALRILVCVLVIACPCSLGLATPTALTVSMGSGASKGILVKNGEAIQRISEIDTVIFDKTGTVTKGKPEVTDFICFNGFDKNNVLSLIGCAESKSEHPLAKSIVDYCLNKNSDLIECDRFDSFAGMGIECIINNNLVCCGNDKLMIKNNVDLSESAEFIKKMSELGKTIIFISVNGSLAGALALSDSLKDGCEEAINKINSLGINTIMLTGDNKKSAESIAKQAGIQKVFSELMPDEKLSVVNELKNDGRKVIMVGDGINDAPSLTAADVGIAVSTGTDIAIESADIVLIGGDIKEVATAINIGKRTMKIIKQNLFWAFAYNCICIPVAAGILCLFGGPLLNPMIGAAAMSLSSISVVTNSLRLRKIKN